MLRPLTIRFDPRAENLRLPAGCAGKMQSRDRGIFCEPVRHRSVDNGRRLDTRAPRSRATLSAFDEMTLERARHGRTGSPFKSFESLRSHDEATYATPVTARECRARFSRVGFEAAPDWSHRCARSPQVSDPTRTQEVGSDGPVQDDRWPLQSIANAQTDRQFLPDRDSNDSIPNRSYESRLVAQRQGPPDHTPHDSTHDSICDGLHQEPIPRHAARRTRTARVDARPLADSGAP